MEGTGEISGSFFPMMGGVNAQNGNSEGNLPILEGKTTFSQAWTSTVKQWLRLVDEGAMPREVVGMSNDQIKQMFLTGQLAMYRSGPWDFADLTASGINYDLEGYPAVEGGERYLGGGAPSAYAISAKIDGAKLEAARKFLSFLNSEKGLQLTEKYCQEISASTKYTAKVDEHMQQAYEDYVVKGKYWWPNWTVKGEVMTKEITAQWQLLIQGKQTPEQTTENIDKKWDSIKG